MSLLNPVNYLAGFFYVNFGIRSVNFAIGRYEEDFSL